MTKSFLLVSVFLALACGGTRGAPDPIAVDSAQFAAVVDAIRAGQRKEVLGATPVPLYMDSALVFGNDSVHRELSRYIQARRAVLEAKNITVLESIGPGLCPHIFSDENSAAFCPEKQEGRFAVGRAQAVPRSPGDPPTVRMIVEGTDLGPGGMITYGVGYVLEWVDGRWKVVKMKIDVMT